MTGHPCKPAVEVRGAVQCESARGRLIVDCAAWEGWQYGEVVTVRPVDPTEGG